MTITRATLATALAGAVVTLLMVGALAFGAGARAAAPPAPLVARPAQAPLQELIPLPDPGQQFPGQRPGQQQGECEPRILIYRDGQLFELRPGQGQQGPGRPGGPQELIPMTPYQGPAVPGLPQIPQVPQIPQMPQAPEGPGFRPVQPRF